MARPKKARVICASPRYRQFFADTAKTAETLQLSADEYEVLRLHDLEGLNQAEVAAQMLISRTAVTALLSGAHAKVADALVNGKHLQFCDIGCTVCEIGIACPRSKKESCPKRQRCRGSCRCEKNCQS